MSTEHREHRLDGCRPVPLAQYLKALGVLRLVAEQADASARGCWVRDGFVLHTRLGRAELEEFFLERYAPTPIVGPWGARPGFFPGSSESSARAALEAITSSELPRLERFRATVATVRQMLERLGIREGSDVDARKLELLEACRATLADDVVPWLDACYVLTNDGREFPRLLGTGGNEGSGSYMSNFAQGVVACVVERKHDGALAAALWGTVAEGKRAGLASGHFQPGGAGGMNGWDFLLCLEGTLLFAAALVRRGESTPGVLAAPFTVHRVIAGHGSAADEGSRGEVWLPLWTQPTSHAELAQLLREGRSEVGRRPARTGSDFARAVATLGVDRGLASFQRYGLQQRNGQSYFAVPMGRLTVAWRPRVALLDGIDGWLDRFRQKAGSSKAPASIGRALRELDEAVMALCQRDDAVRMRALLIALGRCERTMARSLRWTMAAHLTPVPRLTADWLAAVDDSVELRLAAALMSACAGAGREAVPLYANIEPVQASVRRPQWNDKAGREVVWSHGSVVAWLDAILQRRVLAVVQGRERVYRESAAVYADLGDIADFIEGRVDERLLVDLIWACALVDWRGVGARPLGLRVPADEPWPGALYGVLKLCFAGRDVNTGAARVSVPTVPRILRLAGAGRGDEAVRAAVQRLRASGLAPALRDVSVRGEASRRAAAALIFPLGARDVQRLARWVLMPEADVQASVVEGRAQSGETR